jgi:hypothetical protein
MPTAMHGWECDGIAERPIALYGALPRRWAVDFELYCCQRYRLAPRAYLEQAAKISCHARPEWSISVCHRGPTWPRAFHEEGEWHHQRGATANQEQ